MIRLRVNNTLIALACLLILTGCPEWNSVPTVVDQHLGESYNKMVKNQNLCPEHGAKAKNPSVCPEQKDVMAMDGQKAKAVIDAYRQGAVAPAEEAKKGVAFDVKNVGGSGVGN